MVQRELLHLPWVASCIVIVSVSLHSDKASATAEPGVTRSEHVLPLSLHSGRLCADRLGRSTEGVNLVQTRLMRGPPWSKLYKYEPAYRRFDTHGACKLQAFSMRRPCKRTFPSVSEVSHDSVLKTRSKEDHAVVVDCFGI